MPQPCGRERSSSRLFTPLGRKLQGAAGKSPGYMESFGGRALDSTNPTSSDIKIITGNFPCPLITINPGKKPKVLRERGDQTKMCSL
jgi:hypothetical protein